MIPFYLLTDDRQKLQGVQVQHAARIGDGHLEPARRGDADDGEGAEVDRALPRRQHLVTDRGLLKGLDRLGILGLGASLGLLLDLDLERAELVVPSRDAVVLPRWGGGALLVPWVVCTFSSHWATGRSSSKTQGLSLGLNL